MQCSQPQSSEPAVELPAKVGWDEGSPGGEQRRAPRLTLLIRAAKLVANAGEFLVVVRDVSRDGLKVRTFHPLPPDADYSIELSSGERHPVEKVWENGEIKGFRFSNPVELEQLLAECPSGKRKRPVRLRLNLEVAVFSGAGRSEGLIVDISQHGACIVSHEYLAIGERIRIEGDVLPELTARVRWRRRPLYGLIFEQTFRFDELARLAARLMSASESSRIAFEWTSAQRPGSERRG